MKLKVLEIYYPYCLKRIEDGRYVLLNRRYKPLGMMTKDHIGYGPYAVKMKMTAQMAAKLSWQGSDDVNSIYLYQNHDRVTTPTGWTAYAERLKYLGAKVAESES